MPLALDRFEGCILGLALGDALGAPFEGGPAERLLWRIIGRTKTGERRWTDDTQMTIDVIESLLHKGEIDSDDLAVRFATSYRWSRGYGPAASKMLKRISRGEPWQQANRSIYRDGSFGNGAAMRAPVVGLYFADRPAELDDAARRSAVVTHAHDLGIVGAVLIARATAAVARGSAPSEVMAVVEESCRSGPMGERLSIARAWLETRSQVDPREIAHRLGNGVAAIDSCVTALYLAMRFFDSTFVELQHIVHAVKGDTDTIGAMAGAIWGAAHGAAALPAPLLEKLEQRDRLQRLSSALYQRAAEQCPSPGSHPR